MGVLDSLCTNLCQAGIEASAEPAKQNLLAQMNPFGAKQIGEIKLAGRLIDELELFGRYENATQHGPAGSRKVSRLAGVDIDYILSGDIKGKGNILQAKLNVKRTGLIKKKVVEMNWEGHALAEKLNSDSNIKNSLWESLGQLSARDIEIKSDEAAGLIKIHVRDDRQVFSGKMPPFQMYEKIAEHIYAVAGISKTAPPFTPPKTSSEAPIAQPPAQKPEIKYCFKCGIEMPLDAVFCPKCGTGQN